MTTATETSRYRRFGKRMADLVIATPAAVLALPAIVGLSAVSAIVYRAWPLFLQQRVGRHGAPFTIVKIRSLPADTAPDLDEAEVTAVANHRFGTLIRRTHLDELPQLFLVILGTMSIVGPRPATPRLHERFEPSLAQRRVEVRPGLTGLWQVSESGQGEIFAGGSHDLAYVDNMSARLDAWLLGRSLAMVLSGRMLPDEELWRRFPLNGARSLDSVPAHAATPVNDHS